MTPPGVDGPGMGHGAPAGADGPLPTWQQRWSAQAAIGLVWALHWLPPAWLARVGAGLGWLLWKLGKARRHVARCNLSLCLPQLDAAQREALAREHFALLGRSVVERGLLWFAPEERLRQIIQVSGDVQLAERTGRPVMWLLPHFIGLEWAAPALMLFQSRPAVDVYQTQSNPLIDAQILAGRMRFSPERSRVVSRHEGIRPVMRAIREGFGFVNAPDMDFGPRDSAFVPFFGIKTCTLLAPSRLARSMDMLVQPIVVTLLPEGGVDVHFGEPLPDYPSDDPEVDAARFNRWLQQRILEAPAQYFWVHKRFKTRPPGEPSLY